MGEGHKAVVPYRLCSTFSRLRWFCACFLCSHARVCHKHITAILVYPPLRLTGTAV